ncbi:hypothetical protein PISL3812_08027 [Talaromyces islandicus]|uniref:Uncharacterized protein n=1 Tax=Talaromyces islandicus TaxID=28573 RepID=A0A0U1M5U3_TALIS|nr:hypothetical protein PISL3812_08027 [Talaromyces islandicus]
MRETTAWKHTLSGAIQITKVVDDYALKWNEGDWLGRKKGTRPIDIGNATRIGLQYYKTLKHTAKSGVGIGSASNGSLMRCIPTGLFESGERRQNKWITTSKFTHNDLRCTVACAAYNEVVAAIVNDNTPQVAVEIGNGCSRQLGLRSCYRGYQGGRDAPSGEDR